MNLVKKLTSLILVFTLTGCNLVNNKGLVQMLTKVERSGVLNKDATESVATLKSLNKEFVDIINNRPLITQRVEQLAGYNRPITLRREVGPKRVEKAKDWVKKIEDKSNEIIKLIYTLGKKNHELKKGTNQLVLSEEEISENEFIILYSLVFLRNAYNGVGKQLMSYVNTLSKNEKSNKESIKFFFGKFLSLVGMIKVIDNDAMTTLTKLRHMKEVGILNNVLVKNIDKMMSFTEHKQPSRISTVKSSLYKSLSDENIKKIEGLKKDFNASFENKTILFDPSNPDHPLIHPFVVVGNLTWGLINTLAGLGIVLAAAIASPFTPYVDFPRFAIAGNGKQIYADVCGMSPFAGKMSLGLFELDNCTGWRFATEHEGMHANQSALLGPLYIPLAVVSLMLIPVNGEFMEHWADAWAGTNFY